MLKAIHAQQDRQAAKEKARQIVEKLRVMKLAKAAEIVENGIDETLSYYDSAARALALLVQRNMPLPLARLLSPHRERPPFEVDKGLVAAEAERRGDLLEVLDDVIRRPNQAIGGCPRRDALSARRRREFGHSSWPRLPFLRQTIVGVAGQGDQRDLAGAFRRSSAFLPPSSA